jgi:hypothetical protein
MHFLEAEEVVLHAILMAVMAVLQLLLEILIINHLVKLFQQGFVV